MNKQTSTVIIILFFLQVLSEDCSWKETKTHPLLLQKLNTTIYSHVPKEIESEI